jgi:peptidoglycan hydrolase-like protein with peptidoglycan-binding domain
MAEPEMKRQDNPVLKRRDKGPDVTEAQNLLNRTGAILDPDGDFGGGTEEAVREFQMAHNIPVTGIIDAVTWRSLRVQPEPSRDIPTRAVSFIGREEVSSRSYYELKKRPTWPGGASGVTIGIGYDLGYQATFEADWAGLLTTPQNIALKQWVGIRGNGAAAGPAALAGIAIPWMAAWNVFIGRSLPQSVGDTRKVFYRSREMPRLCLGVLVSLVYNRGTSMVDSVTNPGSRREMREIRDAIAAGRFSDIPDLLRAMKRLWPEPNGLRGRRDREAELFEIGLDGG